MMLLTAQSAANIHYHILSADIMMVHEDCRFFAKCRGSLALNRVAQTEVVNNVKKINNSQQLKIKNILYQYQQQHYIQNIFY